MRATMVHALMLFSLLIPLTRAPSAAPVPTLLSPSSAVEIADRSMDKGSQKIGPEVWQALRTSAADEMIPVIVTMKRQADLRDLADLDRDERVRRVVQELQDTANRNQAGIRVFLSKLRDDGLVGPVTHFWVFNGLALSAKAEAIEQLAARLDVARITPDAAFQAPSPKPIKYPVEPNLEVIYAPALWDLGYRGQGIVVANLDTGVYWAHPDLSEQWRGGTNSWFDPYNEHPNIPSDVNGHGTQTMGVMVGRDAGGTAIGVAPDAQWIAVKIFNDRGQATTTGIHAGYQWLLDPDGDPKTADAPHVVNNSWSFGSPGCNLEFQLDLKALRAANILPVFSAGNFGPYSATSTSPANNPEAFAVGAINDFDQIYRESGRGPSNCGQETSVFPEMVAPGVAIRTTERYDLYTDATGTSVAAPHAVGALALLLSAFPQLNAERQAEALLAGAVDLGPAGPDNTFGAGRLDVWASYQFLLDHPPENLALNRPVTVASYLNKGHMGEEAVDGQVASFWATAKAKKGDALPSEWITVDLGSSVSIGAVLLVWGQQYATSYTIQVSDDGSTWTTVFGTMSGDGDHDAITLPSITARYVKMESTAWSKTPHRNWLKEIEVYASGE
jgi:subtilisin family serine protease